MMVSQALAVMGLGSWTCGISESVLSSGWLSISVLVDGNKVGVAIAAALRSNMLAMAD